jgi:hypothetical protein
VLGADAYTAASGGSNEGYPVFHHLEREVDGGIIWAPAIEGGFVLTTRGGDFELDIGQDISIGYLSHSSTTVELYFQETLMFRLLTTEACVETLIFPKPTGVTSFSATPSGFCAGNSRDPGAVRHVLRHSSTRHHLNPDRIVAQHRVWSMSASGGKRRPTSAQRPL